MDKLIDMKLKYDDGTYSDEIPISVLAENVQWDSSHTLVDVLGNVNLTSGSIQDQITYLFNNKISNADMQVYVNNSMPTIITNWLDANVTPVGSEVVVDESLTVEGAAADAKKVGTIVYEQNKLQNISALAAVKKQSVLTPCNVFNKNVATPGHFNDSGDWIKDNTNLYSCSDFIPVTANDIVYKTSGNCYTAFFNSEKVLIGSVLVGKKQSTAPNNSAYVRIAPSNSALDTYMVFINTDVPNSYYAYGDGPEIKLNFNELKTNIHQLSNDVSKIYYTAPTGITWEPGLWKSDGTLSQYGNYKITNYIPVLEGVSVLARNLGSVGGAAAAQSAAFFDINKNFIVAVNTASYVDIIVNEDLSENYKDIAYVSIGTSKSDISDITIELSKNTLFNDFEILLPQVNTLKTNVNQLLNSVNKMYYTAPTEIVWEPGYWKSDGTLSQYGNYKITNYIPVSEEVSILARNLGSVGGTATAQSAAFFDINKNFILSVNTASYVDVIVNEDLSENYKNIAYVSIGTSKNDISDITIKFSKDTLFNDFEILLPQIRHKTVAIIGDSIMMLMRSVGGNNTVSYLGSDGNEYEYSDLTITNGKMYVTANNSITCEIVNSLQQTLDNQDWSALKDLIEANDIINCGMGGATIYTRDIETAYPYPDGDGKTTCISNEALMLKRLVESGRTSPDCIIIWAGTNGAGEPQTDNYDEIMALTWEELSSENGHNYRTTFYGGLRYTLEYLMRNFQYATIIVFTPIQTNPSNYRTYTKLSTTGNAIMKMAKRYSAVVVDALNEIGICDKFQVQNGSGYFLSDGLHPNAKGKALYANFTAERLKTLYFSKRG